MKFKISKSATLFASLILSLSSVSQAHEEGQHSGLDLDKGAEHEEGHHALVHPFMAHMGLPDGPGEVSARVTSVEQRADGVSSGTYGFHIESGIVDGLGLHIRNDAIKFNPSTEVMLQYAVWRTPSKLSGVAVFSELEFPTGSTNERPAGVFGVSGAYLLVPVLAINSTVHYNARGKMTEWEIAFVTRLTKNIFPVIEARGEVMEDEATTNLLGALKYKLPSDRAIGVGYQFPVSSTKEYDSQLLLQAELGFE